MRQCTESLTIQIMSTTQHSLALLAHIIIANKCVVSPAPLGDMGGKQSRNSRSLL